MRTNSLDSIINRTSLGRVTEQSHDGSWFSRLRGTTEGTGIMVR